VNNAPIRLGVAGLGRAFTLMLPTFVADPRVILAAAADPRPAARAQFASAFGSPVHDDVEALCADPAVDAIYIATPHQFHAAHAILAAQHGKHVLVEKPMAISVAECAAMIAAADRAGVQLVVGHSHSFDAPVRRARALIDAGAIGRVRMINAQYYTDFLYRFRRPEELDTAAGGGVVWGQAAHQVDIVRLLGGARVQRVRALTGAWDAARATEGAYAALLTFDDGAFASLLYSGYAHFDSDVFCGDINELGLPRESSRHGAARRALAHVGVRVSLEGGALGSAQGGAQNGAQFGEAAAKAARNDATFAGIASKLASGASAAATAGRTHEHFGVVIVSGERGDLRLLPQGVMVYGDDDVRLDALPPPVIPRREVIDEFHDAITGGAPALHDGRWAMDTLEVCAAILRSAHDDIEVTLSRPTSA
jgi:phthalate 4,5-cis-dihydrodiol dehydrogenase